MAQTGLTRLDSAVDPSRDHILGDPDAAMVLVEYGSYACPACREANAVIARLRDHFGERLCYVYRHRPITGDASARRAAVIAEYAAATHDDFWPAHSALMGCGPVLDSQELDLIVAAFDLPPAASADAELREAAEQRIDEDERSAAASGALVAPTFFINNRRYDPLGRERAGGGVGGFTRAPGPHGGAGLRPLGAVCGHRAADVGPGSRLGQLARRPGIRSDLAYVVRCRRGRPRVRPAADHLDQRRPAEPVLPGGGLEIKREFTVGQLATRRAAALPIAAAVGGMLLPASLICWSRPRRLPRAGAPPSRPTPRLRSH